MISYAEALQRLLAEARACVQLRAQPALHVALADALGAVSAAPVRSRLNVPGFANSALDGYVLRAGATATASAATPVTLAVGGLIPAGTPAPDTGQHAAFEIFTGAPVPAGLDAVVPVERVVVEPGSTRIRISEPLRAGQNIRQAGEDFQQDQEIIGAGVRLGPHHLMALAACGIDELEVWRVPRVAILTTGNELTMHGASMAPGRIRDANGPYLRAMLPELGVELVAMATATDDATELVTQLQSLAANADVVLTSGGVSAGKLDLVPIAIRALGGETIFHKVAIRPGKPLLHARLPNGVLVYGLPGNPLAVAVGMRFFVIPTLRALQGLPPEQATVAETTAPVRGRGRLRFFAKAHAGITASGNRVVQVLPGQESFKIAPLLAANCWAIVTEDIDEIPAGGQLTTLPLYPDD